MVIVPAVDRSGERRKLIEERRSLAAAFDAEPPVVHRLDESELRSPERTSYERTGESVGVAGLEGAATEIAGEATGDDAGGRAVGLVGIPTQRILAYSREKDARHLVLGGRKRSPVGRAIFGGVTQSVLPSADRPGVTVMEEAR